MSASGNDQELHDLPLGQDIPYPEAYDPNLLRAIPRRLSRDSLGISPDTLPFCGEDIWNAYELSWLDVRGKPQIALGEFRFAADTPSIIESKSFKLYLNSLNQARFESVAAVAECIERDLAAVVGASVAVALHTGEAAANFASIPGQCIDEQAIAVTDYHINPDLLCVEGLSVEGHCLEGEGRDGEEQLHSHLFRSLCPVTGQPDWATVLISYRGPTIDRAGLLRYLLSYRQHRDFHEQCVERIFMDILTHCRPEFLQVYARYLRRGGLDINPCRSSEPVKCPNFRLVRQ